MQCMRLLFRKRNSRADVRQKTTCQLPEKRTSLRLHQEIDRMAEINAAQVAAARAAFYERGEDVASWARSRGFRPASVYRLLAGALESKERRGTPDRGRARPEAQGRDTGTERRGRRPHPARPSARQQPFVAKGLDAAYPSGRLAPCTAPCGQRLSRYTPKTSPKGQRNAIKKRRQKPRPLPAFSPDRYQACKPHCLSGPNTSQARRSFARSLFP
jgi:gp16 family phage-associated protein